MHKQSVNFEDDVYGEIEQRRGEKIAAGEGNVTFSDYVNQLLRRALGTKKKR